MEIYMKDCIWVAFKKMWIGITIKLQCSFYFRLNTRISENKRHVNIPMKNLELFRTSYSYDSLYHSKRNLIRPCDSKE